MSRKFLEFLYGLPPSGVPDNPLESAFTHLFEEAAAEEELQMDTSKAPLVKALSAIGIEGGEIDEHHGWCDFHTDCAIKYREASALLADYDNVYKLAQAGWVGTLAGDKAMSNEPAEFHIHFLEIGEAETSDADKAEKLKTITKDAREFATTEVDRDGDNPVEAPDIGTKLAKTKGIGQASDGAAPEGTPKGSTKSESISEAALAIGKCKNCGKNGLNCECDEPDYDYTYSSGGKEYKGREHDPGKKDVTVTEGKHPASCNVNEAFAPNVVYVIGKADRYGEKYWNASENDWVGLEEEATPYATRQEARQVVAQLQTEPAYQNSTFRLIPIHRDDIETGQKNLRSNAQAKGDYDAYRDAYGESLLDEGGHKAGCQCGFCKNKGRFGKKDGPKEGAASDLGAVADGIAKKDDSDGAHKVTVESAAQIAARLLEDDDIEESKDEPQYRIGWKFFGKPEETPEGKTPGLAKKPAAKSLPGRPKTLPRNIKLKEAETEPRECPCPECGGPGRRTGPERFKCRRCGKEYTRKKKTTESFTGVSAIPPVEMGIKGDGLETKGRGGHKLGRKFKMPKQWKLRHPITRLP